MTLELSPIELSDVREALQAFNLRLLGELTHTDDRKYREMLREKLRRYESLQARLSPAVPMQPRVA